MVISWLRRLRPVIRNQGTLEKVLQGVPELRKGEFAMVVVGIDVASQKHDYFIVKSETGEVFSKSSVTICNSDKGYKKLHEDISAFCGAVGDYDVRIGLESTGIYHTNIIMFLLSQNYQVMMINPILTNMARKSDKVHCPKNDNLDSQTICKYLIEHPDEFSPYTTSSYHNEALKSLSRKRFLIVDELRKSKLAVNNLVQVIFPEFKSLFSNIYGSTAIAILKQYQTSKKIARAHKSSLCNLIHGRCSCTADKLIESARNSVGISNDYLAFQLIDAIEEMEHIQHRIDKFDEQIKAYVDELCPELLSIPGVGYVTAGLIMGEIKDIERFHSVDSLIAYSGIDIETYESGKYKATHLRPTKKGSKYLRYALFQVARIAWQCDPTFGAYYHKKINEGKHYYVAITHLQKKILRVVYSILKNRSLYEVRLA